MEFMHLIAQGTSSVQGIVLDLNNRWKRKILKDSSVESRNSWYVLRRRHSLTSAIFTYLKARCMKFLQHEAEVERELVLCTKPFESMVSLRLLQINHAKLEGKFKFLPSELKWLQWKECSVETLPSDFSPSKLAVLDLSESGIERLWGSSAKKVCFTLHLFVIKLVWISFSLLFFLAFLYCNWSKKIY